MAPLTYGILGGLVIVIGLTLIFLRSVSRTNKDLLCRDLCIVWEKDFVDSCDRQEIEMEDIIKMINLMRTMVNSQIKKTKLHLPLLSEEPSTLSKP